MPGIDEFGAELCLGVVVVGGRRGDACGGVGDVDGVDDVCGSLVQVGGRGGAGELEDLGGLKIHGRGVSGG